MSLRGLNILVDGGFMSKCQFIFVFSFLLTNLGFSSEPELICPDGSSYRTQDFDVDCKLSNGLHVFDGDRFRGEQERNRIRVDRYTETDRMYDQIREINRKNGQCRFLLNQIKSQSQIQCSGKDYCDYPFERMKNIALGLCDVSVVIALFNGLDGYTQPQPIVEDDLVMGVEIEDEEILIENQNLIPDPPPSVGNSDDSVGSEDLNAPLLISDEIVLCSDTPLNDQSIENSTLVNCEEEVEINTSYRGEQE